MCYWDERILGGKVFVRGGEISLLGWIGFFRYWGGVGGRVWVVFRGGLEESYIIGNNLYIFDKLES